VLPYLVYTLENAIVSSQSLSSGGGDRPVETLTLNYTKIKWDFTQQKADTGKKGNNGAIWDLALNTPA
jgi:type VI secretion system secreted protein Hcp